MAWPTQPPTHKHLRSASERRGGTKPKEDDWRGVNSTNVLDEGLRIGEIGHRMNSKVKLIEIGVYRK
jgi:hypothetical protein